MFNRRTRDGAHGVEWFYKALTQVVGLYKIMPRSSRSFLLFGKFDQIAIYKFLACFCSLLMTMMVYWYPVHYFDGTNKQRRTSR